MEKKVERYTRPLRTLISPSHVNVIVHGMVLVEVKAQTLLVHLPLVHGHTFGAGNFRTEQNLRMGATYSLTLTKPTGSSTSLPIDKKLDAVVSLSDFSPRTVDKTKGFCTLDLGGLPQNMLRGRLLDSKGKAFFVPGKIVSPDKYPQPPTLPLAYLFQYDYDPNPSFPLPRFIDENGTLFWRAPNPDGVQNFHIWAAESFTAKPDHLGIAIAGMNAMFVNPLDLSFSINDYIGPDPEAIPGEIGVDESLSLAEWRAVVFRADNIQNCWTLFATP